MKIGFDISQTGHLKAGTGYLAYSLIRALAQIDTQNEYLLYPTFGDFFLDPDWIQTISPIDQANFQRGLGHRNLKDASEFWRNPLPDFEEKLGKPDLIHANNFYCPSGIQHAHLIYTLYDLGFLAEPDTTTETNRIGCFTGVFRASLYAKHILAISNYTRQHFLDTFPHYPPEKISVIPLASRFSMQEPVPAPIQEGTIPVRPNQFWLNVGTLEPRKNQVRLLKAYALLKAKMGKTYPLVFAGGKGWLLENFVNTIHELELAENVIMLGYVDDNQLSWLYQNCYAFVYPSLFEGFGLPVLEAMSLGAAVITSNTTSLPEVVGDAGLLVDPYQEEEIMTTMQQMQADEAQQKRFKKMALARSKRFSWKHTAETVFEIYTNIYNSGKEKNRNNQV